MFCSHGSGNCNPRTHQAKVFLVETGCINAMIQGTDKTSSELLHTVVVAHVQKDEFKLGQVQRKTITKIRGI